MFYQNLLGYNFVSLSNLLTKPDILDIKFESKNLTGNNPISEMSGARSLEVVAQTDGMEKARSGVNAGKFVGFDPTTGTVAKKKTPPIGKPKRGGSKKFYVFVRKPGGGIKKVSFGMAGGGLRAKLNNPKARRAFAKRHNCAQAKDRTTARYWSCRLPRYAKLLGFKTSFSGYW